MSYFQNEQHFLNYIKKVVKRTGRKVELLPESFYVSYIWEAGKAEAFTWAVKTKGVHYLEEPLIWEWLSESHSPYRSNEFAHRLTGAFVRAAEDVQGMPGVYGFWSPEDVVLYIGRSINLGSSLLQSFNRFHAYDRPVYTRHIITQSAADAVVLEAYFITTWNPPLNGADNYQDGLTLIVEPIPEWSELARCNWVIREGDENAKE